MKETFLVLIARTFGIVVLLAVIILPVKLISAHYDKVNCYNFGRTTNREVKFERYNFWTWSCQTPTKDGKWLPTDQLRDVE